MNAFTQHIPGRVQQLIETGRFSPILYTLFVNVPQSPYQKLLQWHACSGPPETDLVDELTDFAEEGNVYTKHGLTYGDFTSTRFVRLRRIQELMSAGLLDDMLRRQISGPFPMPGAEIVQQ